MSTAVEPGDLRAFLNRVTTILERLSIPYMVVGGFAAISYGEPRMTVDVDIVVDMRAEQVRQFVTAFPTPEYYASEEGILDSLNRRYPFNVLHASTGAKIDLVPLPRDPFTYAAFRRRQRLPYDEAGHTADFITAEDIVIAKLRAYRETASDKHLRDARGVLLVQWGEIDLPAIRRMARAASVLDTLERVLATVNAELEDEKGPD